MGGGVKQLGIQLVGLVAVLVFSGGVALILWAGLKSLFGLRVSKTAEINGLDLVLHQEAAYSILHETNTYDGSE